MASGQFGLDDFRDLMQKLRKPGLMTKMLGLMPGMGDINKMLANTDSEKELSRLAGMVDSMTKAERKNPKLIDQNRRNRIAAGSGVAPNQVNDLVKQFNTMAPLMQMMAGGSKGDRMKMLQQLQSTISADPTASFKVKQSTGKRLSEKERQQMQRDREKALRKLKRKNK